MLKQHGRYAFSPITARPSYSWPNGKKLAVYIALNIEHFSFGEGLGSSLAGERPPLNHRNYAWRDWGNRVGVWRLFDLFDELNIPVAHLVNTAIYDYAPEIMAPIRRRGDEVVGHGRSNAESQNDMSEAEERRLLSEVRETIQRHEGKPPGGWMGPWMTETRLTLDLLKETGYRYSLDWPADDQPIWLKTRSGPLLNIPYPLEVNDSPAIVYRHAAHDEFARMIVDSFEEMRFQAEKQPLVLPISLHTFVIAQPFRLRELRRALRHIADRAGEIWLTRPGDISDHIHSLPEGTVPGR
jgi:allantoinase